MGKNSGGVTDWHKQQHKKLLTKNKVARIAARDERVVQEKTIVDVKSEIRKIEQRYKTVELRPHAVQSKLDRLNKELKLVTAKEEADKKKRELLCQEAKDNHKYEPNVTYVPLARPEVSIYYHPTMNPYGAPPPGQPQLYFCRGGGTTENIDHACSRLEQFLPPPPPQNQHRKQQPQFTSTPLRRQSQQIPQSVNHQRNAGMIKSNHGHSESSTKSGLKPFPTELPELPKPSTSVVRSKHSTLTNDIWASTEEIQYEETVSLICLEGTATAAHNHSQWYYQDMSGIIQGPYPTEHMRQWNFAGYFPHTTLVSGSSSSGPWKPLSEIKSLNESNNGSECKIEQSETIPTQLSVQDRIAALKAQHSTSEPKPSTFIDRTVYEQSCSYDEVGITDPEMFNNDVKPSCPQRPPPPPPPPSGGAMSHADVYLYPIDDDRASSSQFHDGEYETTEEHETTRCNELLDCSHNIDQSAADDAHPNVPVIGAYEEELLSDENDVIGLDGEENNDNEMVGTYKEEIFLGCDKEHEQQKKKVKVDHAIVSLIPSSMRKR